MSDRDKRIEEIKAAANQRWNSNHDVIELEIGDVDLLCDEIARLRERLRVMEWQPIETAPQDGTHVIVGTFPASHMTITTAHYWEHDAEWALSVNARAEYSNHGVEKPTHWIPLPEPPALASGSEKP